MSLNLSVNDIEVILASYEVMDYEAVCFRCREKRLPFIFPDELQTTIKQLCALYHEIKNKEVTGEIDIGSYVRVKPYIVTPVYGWGKYVTHSSVGRVVAKRYIGNICQIKIDFPEHSGWNGLLDEVELAKTVGVNLSKAQAGTLASLLYTANFVFKEKIAILVLSEVLDSYSRG